VVLVDPPLLIFQVFRAIIRGSGMGVKVLSLIELEPVSGECTWGRKSQRNRWPTGSTKERGGENPGIAIVYSNPARLPR